MERWGLALVAGCGDSLLSVRLGRTDGVGTVVDPLKAPSSAGKSAARKSESAAPPAAPGPSEFAASLQGLFGMLDTPPLRPRDDAPPPLQEEKGREGPSAPSLPDLPGSRPVPGGREPAPKESGAVAPAPEGAGEAAGSEGSAGIAPAIERALGALDELRRREGLQPVPAAPPPAPEADAEAVPASSAPASTAPAPTAPLPPAEPESPQDVQTGLPPAAPPEGGETAPEFKDLQILETETSGVPALESPESPLPARAAAALPAFVPVQAGFEAAPPAPAGDADEHPGAVSGVAAASGARGGSPKAGPRGAEPATPAETVDRIVQAAQLLKTRGATRLRLRLNPPNLGGLRVDLSVRQGVLQGKIQAENPAARDLLVAQLDRLKAALEAQGLQVGEFQVGVDQSFQQASGESSWTGGSFGSGKRGSSGEGAGVAAAPETPVRRPADPRMFDVTI